MAAVRNHVIPGAEDITRMQPFERQMDAGPRRRRLVVAILLALIVSIVWAGSAGAHAALESSDPAANVVLPAAPPRVTMRFIEPLERATSTKAALYDQVGQLVQGTSYEFGDSDPYVMTLVLPAQLPNGTYSVVWQTLSAADGHTAEGYIPFTIGTVDDVRSVVPPDLGGASGPPEWLRTLARWISYMGVAIVVGTWPVWLLVLRPAISPAWQAGPRLVRRVRAIAYAGVLVALLGSLLALYVQINAADDGAGFVSTARTMLSDTRYGKIWIFRVALTLAAGVAFMGAAWWWPRRQRVASVALLLVVALVPVPFALISHASAQTDGRTTAIAVDYLHLASVSLWVGGLVLLVGGLVPTLRVLTPAGRRVVLQRALPRFSAVALGSWAVILLTGIYAGWLQVGGLKPLLDTDYGESLTIKMLLIVPLLALAAFNLLVVSRRITRTKSDDDVASWGRKFTIAVIGEVVLVVAVLLVAGRLTTQQPARDALAQEANQIDVVFDLQGRQSTLSLAPGKPGPNHYRLQVGGDPLPADSEALLRLTVPSLNTAQNEVVMERTTGNAFEVHGSEISVEGTYSIDVIVRQIGGFQWTATVSIPIESSNASDLPGDAWKFTTSGVLGLALIVIGFSACAFAWWTGRGPLRKEAWGWARSRSR